MNSVQRDLREEGLRYPGAPDGPGSHEDGGGTASAGATSGFVDWWFQLHSSDRCGRTAGTGARPLRLSAVRPQPSDRFAAVSSSRCRGGGAGALCPGSVIIFFRTPSSTSSKIKLMWVSPFRLFITGSVLSRINLA